jgi:hypothetical protein
MKSDSAESEIIPDAAVRHADNPLAKRIVSAVLRAAGVIAVRGDGRKWGDALGSEVRGH